MSVPRQTDLCVGFDAWGLSGTLYYTGMGQYAANVLRWLPRAAPELRVVAYGGPSEERPKWLPKSITWRSIGRRVPGKLSALYSWLVSLPAAVRDDGIDVFHAPAVHMRPFFPPVPRLQCPVVATLHDVIPMTYYNIRTLPVRQRLFYRWNLGRAARADVLVTVSEHSRREIAGALRIDPSRIQVIYNAIDFSPEPDARVLEELGVRRPYVLFAGSHEPRKNLNGALEAFARLVADGSPLALAAVVDAGSGHSVESQRRLLEAGLGDRVRLVDSLSDHQLRALYADAEALLFPSFAEGFGLPPLQAAACGVAVVAADLPVLREMLGDAAVYVDPRSPAAIADGVAHATTDQGLRAALKLRGPEIAARFSPLVAARRHAHLYATLAGREPALVRQPIIAPDRSDLA